MPRLLSDPPMQTIAAHVQVYSCCGVTNMQFTECVARLFVSSRHLQPGAGSRRCCWDS